MRGFPRGSTRRFLNIEPLIRRVCAIADPVKTTTLEAIRALIGSAVLYCSFTIRRCGRAA